MNTRSRSSEDLAVVSNEELAKIERENNRNRRINMARVQDQHDGPGNERNFPIASCSQSRGQGQQFQPQAYRPNQGQQGYQNQKYGQNRPFGQSFGQNRYQNSNYNQGGFQQKQPFNSFQPKNPTQFQTGESSVPAAKESKLESMLQQLMLNQQKTGSEINTKVDNINVKVDTMFQDMNNKWESLSAHVKKLETQVAQTAEAVQRPTGVLPGRGAISFDIGEEHLLGPHGPLGPMRSPKKKKTADRCGVFQEDTSSLNSELLYGPPRYHFEQRPRALPNGPLRQAHEHIGNLQRWNKAQDITIFKLKDKCKKLSKTVKRQAEASAQFMKKVADLLTRGAFPRHQETAAPPEEKPTSSTIRFRKQISIPCLNR
ncbi:hypothetical protein F2Q68_00033885 [Brassica cretica]|uniref:Arabidopsis retrotransposon Orf1 C-terminal domain-containing protein n=1 Tax=Brassica cretica TaxID=69181 RepID=A0A8S9H122_BRACR|nr:hypothetical protein F2Q68_00033885 [Brassica cretica]